jgi:hypothetical protein
VGYVLATDPRYATILKAADSTVQILELDDVESRTSCRLIRDWSLRPWPRIRRVGHSWRGPFRTKTVPA